MKAIGKNLMVIIVVAILCVTALETIALLKGMNGACLTSTIGALVGIPAWFVSKQLAKKKDKSGD